MIKAILLILEPVAAWERIVQAQRSLVSILLVYLAPLLLLTAAVEAYGLIQWGKWRVDVVKVRTFTLPEAVAYEFVQIVLSLAVVFMGAKLLKNLGETFHGRHTYTQAFTAVAYGLGPFFLVRLLDAVPAMSPWVTYAIGIVLTATVLYQGVPRVMLPDPPHAMGLYIMSAILLAITAGLARFLTAWLQQGRFEGLEAVITNLAARVLPG